VKSVRLLFAIVVLLWPASVWAGVRHFTFIYEAPTSAPGSFDFENSVTWKRTTNPGESNQIDFRHEIEYGVTDHFQASVYVADWFYENGSDRSGTIYSDNAIELIYNLTNPVVDPVGFSLYQEYRFGYRFFEWESKAILQKNFGPWIFAYNATLEAVWDGEGLSETEGELSQALGASYEISPRLSVGLEMLHEVVLPEWKNTGTIRNFFVGPNVSYRRGRWFVTATALAQATDTTDEADFQVRTIFGMGF
jgi:hypothetical protein